MKRDLHEMLSAIAETLPPHLQEKFARDVIKEIGTEKVAIAIMTAVMTDAPTFREAVADVKRHEDSGPKLIEHTRTFMDDMRAAGKDFDECWAAMNILLSLGTNSNSVVEMLGYCLTRIVFESPPGKTEKTTRSAEQQFLDLANELRDGKL